MFLAAVRRADGAGGGVLLNSVPGRDALLRLGSKSNGEVRRHNMKFQRLRGAHAL